MKNSRSYIVLLGTVAALLMTASPVDATELPNFKSNDGAAQVLVKQAVCAGPVALIVGIRTGEQIKGVLAHLPDKVAKSVIKLAHTTFMILHADTKTVKLLMKEQDVLTVHQNSDPKRAKEQIAKAQRNTKRMNALKVAAEFTPVPVIVALALPEDASSADIAKTRNALLGSLSDFDIRNIKLFKCIPHVAMAVSKAALQVLAASPLVCGVHSDQQARPL